MTADSSARGGGRQSLPSAAGYRSLAHRRSSSVGALPAALVALLLAVAPLAAAQKNPAKERVQAGGFVEQLEGDSQGVRPMHEIYEALLRLPLAGALGA